MTRLRKNLEPNTRSEDVKALQDELSELGFTISDPEGFFGSDTARAIRDLQQRHGLQDTGGKVERQTLDLINKLVADKQVGRHTVLGRITGNDGAPIPGARIEVFAKGLRKETRIARALASDDGDFAVDFLPERTTSAIIVRAFDQSEKEIASSAIIVAPKLVEHVDLAPIGAPRQLPQVEQITRAAETTLKAENLRAADLTDAESALLASKIGMDESNMKRFVEAARVGAEINAPLAILYGLLGKGIPATIPALLKEPPEVLRSALKQAVDENEIPVQTPEAAESFFADLNDLAVQRSFVRPETPGTFSMRELLETGGISSQDQEQVLRKYVAHRGDTQQFWTTLRGEGTVPATTIDELQFTLQLGALTRNHVPLVRELRKRHEPRATRDLVKLDRAAWLEMIRGAEGAGTPPGLPGKTLAEREEHYATVLAEIIEESFPTPFLTARLAEAPAAAFIGRDDVVKFLESNPDFTFEGTRLERYLEEHGTSAVTGIGDVDSLKRNLKAIGRLFPIAGRVNRHEIVQPLLAEGFTSAFAIDRTGGAFVAQFKKTLGDSRARAVFNAARNQSALAQTLFAQFSPTMHGVMPQAIGPQSKQWTDLLPRLPDIPDWKTLFGAGDFCACNHCSSIHGPAAYLVDLLVFVKNQDALGKLLATGRRPDLGEIELTCQNTETVLPYIDLVNEILERAVTPGEGFPQTTKTAEELRAQPEHRNDAAYTELAEAVYPWSLPFAFAVEEARAYLAHLGTPRNEIMETFRPEGSLEPSPHSIAADRLGLTPVERRIITGAPLDPPKTLQSFWGLSGLSLDELRDRVVRPRGFLEQAGLSYSEVVELFATRFVAETGRVTINFEVGGCDLDRAVIEPQPSASRLDRVHRFERLRRRLGWSFYDLDCAIAALQPDQINDDLLVALAHLRRLRADFKVPLEEMLVWWSPLDTHVYRPQGRDDVASLYERVFQNPVVFDGETIAAFALDASGTELERSDDELAPRLPSVAAALGASTEELQTVAGIDATLSLATLSELYRTLSLARTLRLTVRNLMTLRRLSSHDPFASPAETIRFRNELAAMTAAGFSLPQVEYLLAHTESPGVSVAPDDIVIAAALTQLRTALREIRAQYVLVSDPEGTATASALGILLPRPIAQSAVTLIRSGVLIPSGDPAVFLQTHLLFLDVAAAIEALVGIDESAPTLSPVTQTAERFGFVLAPLLAHLHQTVGKSVIVQTLAATFNMSARILSAFLGDNLTEFEDERLLAEEVEVSRSEFPELFRTLYRLWKAGIIVSTLRLSDSEGEFLLSNAGSLGVLDLRTLPGSPPLADALTDEFAGFLRLIELISLRDSVGAAFFDILRDAVRFRAEDDGDAATEAFLQRLHQLTGWEIESLLFLASKGGLALVFPDHYRSGYAGQRFRACFDALKRLGLASAHVVPGWITDGVSPEASRAIRSAAKAKYDSAQWLEVARGINDDLRERLRDALVAHLLASHSEFRDAADLYGHFLIDPEMSACQLTSRLRLAISSVQLFVQRALLNLEGDIEISQEAAAEWPWMKNYRVWEANRKVFLYPENWITPELREDKTPLFRNFEKALLQGDLSDRTLGSAFSAYVLGLAEIARPEISAIYSDPATHTHHLFARTRELPHLYYYRRWDRARTWTPWEPLPLDIEGEHLVPVLIRERFYLFWPVFQEKSDPPKHGDDETNTFHELRLAWSVWQEGEWSAKRLSEATLRLPGAFPLNRYLFRALQRSSEPLSQGGFQVSSGSFGRKIVILFLPGALASVELGRFQLVADGSVTVESLEGVLGKNEPGPDRGLLSGMVVLETGLGSLILPSAETDSFGNVLYSSLVHLVTLNRTPGEFRIVYPDQFEGFATQSAFTYEDGDAAFLVQPIRRSQFGPSGGLSGTSTLSFGIQHTHGIDPNDVGDVFPLALERSSFFAKVLEENTSSENVSETGDALTVSPFVSASGSPAKEFRFYTHYHPLADDFVTALFNDGIDGILGRLEHQENGDTSFFEQRYDPVSSRVAAPHPLDGVDFSYEGAYSVYNWELFFHIPLLLADRFQQEQRFADAQRWYHYVFDPTRCEDDNAPRCYWKVRPFFEYDLSDPESRPVQEMLVTLSQGNMALSRQVAVWRENPFDPHSIARLRTIAYQKAVVMKYLDNLIAWADALFRQDTLETLNEATQLYVLATQILGKRPERIDTGAHPPAKTFIDLEDSLDAFSNALVEIENQLGPNGFANSATFTFGGETSSSAPPPLGTTLFFCIPENEKLLGYWDTVEDRLFKIRHCMNIEGVIRTLPLFSPPIEPGLLVKAAAAGVDITSAINDLQAPLGPYRFRFLLEKALEFTNAVKTLGSSLLDALSQRDGEALARIRAAHETELLKLVHDIKEKQISEAGEQLVALQRSRNIAEERKRYYEEIPDRIEEETEHLEELESAGSAQERASSHDLTSADAARFIPDFSVGFSGVGPFATISLGRANILAFYQFRSQEMSAEAGKSTHASNLAGIRGAWIRRTSDWTFLAAQAAAEIRQIDKQVAATEIREAIARKELEVHDRQTLQSEAVETFMRGKYTNEELHSWRVSQLSSLFFQSYQKAYDLAQKAERAFRHELGIEGTSFIEFGNWDNLRKGLLSGERLELQLRRLESAYLEENRREYELTNHISLAMLNPLALLRLKQEGRCEIELPEELYDLDYPGHYFRRIKSASISIPAVTGPYTSVCCTLRLLRSSIRRQSTLLSGQYARVDGNDPRFSDSFGTIQSIAASSCQNDSGVFELNFRDERYLPFEGAGAISGWQLEMPDEFRQFDYDSISDVILHIRFTAREGGRALQDAVNQHLLDGINAFVTGDNAPGLHQPISARHEFPTEFHRFLHPPAAATAHTLRLDLTKNRFPFVFRDRTVQLLAVHLFLKLESGFAFAEDEALDFELRRDGGTTFPATWRLSGSLAQGLPYANAFADQNQEPGIWLLLVNESDIASLSKQLRVDSETQSVMHTRLNPDAIDDIIMICQYRVA